MALQGELSVGGKETAFIEKEVESISCFYQQHLVIKYFKELNVRHSMIKAFSIAKAAATRGEKK